MPAPRKGWQYFIGCAFLLAVVHGSLATTPLFAAPQSQVLHRFEGSDGQFPSYGNLILDTSGNLYGTTYYGGDYSGGCGYGCGTVFKLTPGNGTWTETVLHEFEDNGQDGYYPVGSLAMDATGNLYGTTTSGGTIGVGTVFKLSPNGDGTYAETVLYSFCSIENCLDGAAPEAGVILDAVGNLYGTTSYGGDDYGGVVYKLTPAGSGNWEEKVLYSLLGAYGGGSYASLAFDKSGNLYGTTDGSPYCTAGGTVFKLSPRKRLDWYYTLLYQFSQDGKDGACPSAGVVLDPAGNVYSTTFYGGESDAGVVFKLSHGPRGKWKETVLHSFTINDGAAPYAGVALDGSGNLYGTLAYGGRNGLGSVFKLTPTKHRSGPDGMTEKILLNFDGYDGTYPYSGLTFDSAGNLYGATYYGGKLSDCNDTGCGVIFEITP